ncbi:MAG: ATP-binding protein [Candidatus Aminicenantes bacterium]|nr:MAG: ATP-binding protein [Candidatus Aminicenantes bacterium]
MIKDRYLTGCVVRDLYEKMVFIGGARQVGKTTFAVNIVAEKFKNSAYYNWDKRSDRKQIIQSDWPGNAELIILDEVHKYKNWKNLIKGEYDKLKHKYKFLITGSARLNIYRRGGDSLQGRYHYYRLHPFSLAELLRQTSRIEIFKEILLSDRHYKSEFDSLFEFGGFPEPLLKESPRFLRRWHNEKIERMFREDITDIEQIRDLGNMKLLSDILPEKVGSLLSVNSIREDLEVSHRAVSNWLNILEIFYYHFRIYPFTGKIIRSIKKEPKLYLWDWSEVKNPSARFENLIAVHLLKLCHYLYDYEGYKAELYFLRNVDKKEVDFLVTNDKKPWFVVETKLSDKETSKSLFYYKERLKIPFVYQVMRESGINRFINDVHIVSADCFLSGLI